MVSRFIGSVVQVELENNGPPPITAETVLFNEINMHNIFFKEDAKIRRRGERNVFTFLEKYIILFVFKNKYRFNLVEFFFLRTLIQQNELRQFKSFAV